MSSTALLQFRNSRSCFRPEASTACRRAILLASSALVGVGLLAVSVPGAHAACEIEGLVVDPADPLNAGDDLICDDVELTEPIVGEEPRVTVTFGNGEGIADTTITLEEGDNRAAISVIGDSAVTLNADAEIAAPNPESDGIDASGGGNNVTVNGGKVDVGRNAINASGDKNTIDMNGGVLGGGVNGAFVEGDLNRLTVNGGDLKGAAGGISVIGSDNTVEVNGGKVAATGDEANAISVSGGGNRILLNGGLISAYDDEGKAVEILIGLDTVDTLVFGTGAQVFGDLVALDVNTIDGGQPDENAGVANLVLNGLGDRTFDDDISGFDTLTKQDDGRFTLGGTIDAGTMNIDQGLLAIDGDASNSIVNINSGGILGGNGVVGITTVGDGGTVAAGNSIGTLTVNDDLLFQTGSFLEVEIDDAGNVDLVEVRGNINIKGGAVNLLSNFTGAGNGTAFVPGASFTILRADKSVYGIFEDVVEDFAFLDAETALSNNRKELHLLLDRNDVAFADLAETDNARAAAEAAESTGEYSDLFNALVGLSENEAPETISLLTGEINASLQGILVQESSSARGIANSELRSILSPETEGAETTSPYGRRSTNLGKDLIAWGAGYGSIITLDGDGNASTIDSTSGGFVAGAGKTFKNGLHTGLFAGYGRNHVSIDDLASDADVDSYTVGAYAGRRIDALRLQFGAAYSLNDISTERTVTGGPLDETLTAHYNAHTLQAFSEMGYRFKAGYAVFEPFAGLAHVTVLSDGFTESGGISALTADSNTQNVTYTNLGVRMETSFPLGGAKGRLHGLAGWQHAFGDTTASLEQAFVAGGDAFTIFGAPIAQNAAIFEAGLDLQVSRMSAFGIGYNGRLSDSDAQHSLSGRFSLKY